MSLISTLFILVRALFSHISESLTRIKNIQPNRPYKPSTGLEGADITVAEHQSPQKRSSCLEGKADSWDGGGKVQETGTPSCTRK